MSDQDTYHPQPALVPARRVQPAPAGRVAGLGAIIARIEETVEAETVSIRTDVHFDLQASNARKSRYLYELNKALKDVRAGMLAEHRDDIIRLKGKLAENEMAIQAHLDAVNEVAGLLRDAIESSETDGTYSSGAFGSRRLT